MNLRDLPARWKERWQSLTLKQKIAIVLTTVALVTGLFYASMYLLRPNYAPLFSDLEVQEAGAITEKLKSLDVKYRVNDQGRTILVPEDEVYDLRMQLASEGVLPDSGKGFELFDETKLAQTDFEQQVVYQRALQDELRRSIQSLDAVEQARVHLVLPERSVFIEDEKDASASVVLKLKPLAKLEKAQIKGINDLLVGSVEGLKPENVHIIDTQGNPLNDFIKSSSDPQLAGNDAIQQQMQLREQIEQNMEKRLKQFLLPVYGPGKTLAMVSVDLDFSKAQTTRKEVLPGEVLSEQSESASGTDGNTGGAAGTTSQMPGTDYPGSTFGEGGEYDHESNITNYELGEEVTVVEQPPGAIQRISTSVIVDSNAETPVDEMAVQRIVSSAIGYEPERGDEITVQTMPFDTSLEDDFDEEAEDEGLGLAAYLAIAAALAALALLTVYIIRRRRARKAEEQMIEEPVPVAQIDVEAEAEAAEREKTMAEIATAAAKDPSKDLKEMAKRNPDEVAQIIKLWLKE